MMKIYLIAGIAILVVILFYIIIKKIFFRKKVDIESQIFNNDNINNNDNDNQNIPEAQKRPVMMLEMTPKEAETEIDNKYLLNIRDQKQNLLMMRRKDLYYVLLALQMRQNSYLNRRQGLVSLPFRLMGKTFENVDKFIRNYEYPDSKHLDFREHPYYKNFIGFNDYSSYLPPVVRSPQEAYFK